MAVPATGVAALVSMGMIDGLVPLGGVKELVAYTVVAGLVPGTVIWNRLLYRGLLTPPPQMEGVQEAMIPAPPKDCAVTVVPVIVATAGLSVSKSTGAEVRTNPFSSLMSASRISVWPWVIVADVVRFPGVSPGRCSLISIGMQVLKLTAGEETVVLVAKTPVSPGLEAVTSPWPSTVPTGVLVLPQVKGPTRLVISVAL